MATFARQGFNAANYLSGRPTIPLSIVQHALSRAERPLKKVADLGCGPGQLARTLAESKEYESVLGVDPSEKMIEVAKSQSSGLPVKWAVGTAENAARWAEPESLDAILVVQAAHWFRFDRAYDELARVLRPGGLLAFLSYGLWYLPSYPQATTVIRRVMLEELAPYWEDGRSHVDAEIDTIPSPDRAPGADAFLWRHASNYRAKWIDDPTKIPAYQPSELAVKVDERKEAALDRSWTQKDIASYIRSFSAIHTQEERHGPGLAERFAKDLWAATGKDAQDVEATVTVRWPVTLLAAVRA